MLGKLVLLIKQKLPKQVKKIILRQTFLAILLSAICLFVFNRLAAISLFLGAAVCILSSAIFAQILFRFTGAQQSKKIVKAFYRGESYKILITVVLFFLIFKYLDLNVLFFLLGFILAQAIFWVALLDSGK